MAHRTRLRDLTMAEDTENKERAAVWGQLADKAAAFADQARGAAFSETNAPYATGAFKEIETELRQQLAELTATLDAVTTARRKHYKF